MLDSFSTVQLSSSTEQRKSSVYAPSQFESASAAGLQPLQTDSSFSVLSSATTTSTSTHSASAGVGQSASAPDRKKPRISFLLPSEFEALSVQQEAEPSGVLAPDLQVYPAVICAENSSSASAGIGAASARDGCTIPV